MWKACYLWLIIIFLVGTVEAGVPKTIHYQGRLVATTGSVPDGTIIGTFSVWNADTGGSKLWEESQAVQLSQEGLFSVILGKQTPIDLPFDTGY